MENIICHVPDEFSLNHNDQSAMDIRFKSNFTVFKLSVIEVLDFSIQFNHRTKYNCPLDLISKLINREWCFSFEIKLIFTRVEKPLLLTHCSFIIYRRPHQSCRTGLRFPLWLFQLVSVVLGNIWMDSLIKSHSLLEYPVRRLWFLALYI